MNHANNTLSLLARILMSTIFVFGGIGKIAAGALSLDALRTSTLHARTA